LRIRWILLAVSITLATGALGFAAAGRLGSHRQAVSEHPVTIPRTARAVNVSATMPAPSRSARDLSAMLEEGVMPAHETAGVVMSDTECTPDASMISHCRNEIRLQDGSTIVLRHPHDMRYIPCLAPGERVDLVPNA
jgi:hypothetical protein